MQLVLVTDCRHNKFVVLKEKLEEFLALADEFIEDLERYEFKEFSIDKFDYYEEI